MKKVSRVFLIIGGIFGILFSLYFAAAVGVYLLGGTGLGITGLVYCIMGLFSVSSGGGDGTMSQLMGGGAMFIIYGAIVGIVGSIVFGIAFLSTLLSGVFGLVALSRKKAMNIVSIVFTALSFGWVLMLTPAAIYLAVYMLILWFVFLILALTPIAWIYLGFLLLVVLGWLSVIFIILGNIFGLISIHKDRQAEIIEEPVIDVVQ